MNVSENPVLGEFPTSEEEVHKEEDLLDILDNNSYADKLAEDIDLPYNALRGTLNKQSKRKRKCEY